MLERPKIVKAEHLDYLDDLRKGGVINMVGARPFLAKDFNLSREDSTTIHSYWIKSFNQREDET